MKVGLMTTWNTQCGIAEYSRALAEAMQARGDVELTVLGSRNYGDRSVGRNEDYVIPAFDVEAWNPEGRKAIDVEAILALELDVLHVQYEQALFDTAPLNDLLRRFRGAKFVTWHDLAYPPDLEWQRFDEAFTHREGVGPGEPTVTPLAIRRIPPVVRTFGLGRTREDVIRPICDRNGWVFESIASSEAPLGGQTWRPWRELHDWLRGADVIVLWYADDPMAGSSAAARTAIATRRPVIVNDTSWFRELPQQSGAFYKLRDDPATLEATLREILRPDTMIERFSTDAVVDNHVERYRAVIERRAEEPVATPRRGLRGALGGIAERVRALLGRLAGAVGLARLRRARQRGIG